MSNTSMPANFLNRTALPSITGLPASGPMAPRPSTAVPLVSTATRFCRVVRLAASCGIGDDRLAGEGDAGRIGEREVALVGERLGRGDLQLARARLAMEMQRVGFEVGRAFARHAWSFPCKVRGDCCPAPAPAASAKLNGADHSRPVAPVALRKTALKALNAQFSIARTRFGPLICAVRQREVRPMASSS